MLCVQQKITSRRSERCRYQYIHLHVEQHAICVAAILNHSHLLLLRSCLIWVSHVHSFFLLTIISWLLSILTMPFLAFLSHLWSLLTIHLSITGHVLVTTHPPPQRSERQLQMASTAAAAASSPPAARAWCWKSHW